MFKVWAMSWCFYYNHEEAKKTLRDGFFTAIRIHIVNKYCFILINVKYLSKGNAWGLYGQNAGHIYSF